MSNKHSEHKEPRDVVVEFENPLKHPGSAGESSGAPSNDSSDSLAQDFARLQSEKEELAQTLVRRQADFDNYRKRVERESAEQHKRGVARMIEDLIPVMDSFDRALKSHTEPAYQEHRKGLEMVYRQLWESVARHGLERIAAAGKQFDPHWHQAIERVVTLDYPDGAIIDVLQDGYVFHGKVLRPSIVRVAVHPAEAGGESSSAAHH